MTDVITQFYNFHNSQTKDLKIFLDSERNKSSDILETFNAVKEIAQI